MARRIVAAAAAENQRYAGSLGSVGLVVGATIGSALEDLDIHLGPVRGPILAPGLGAQGGPLRPIFERRSALLPHCPGDLQPGGILAAGPSLAGLRAATEGTLAGLRSE